ncbi:Cuticular protein analogous to peritrophins 3-A1 [Nesidiocoris tenuis]|uniref:Cuticular protein analogous to peritrophins 3-A1 n=1 Tax=Nesidiocoris tenuis TaxID=355587 RepID=A0ABN7AA24_9HEMI|nr:Cuticular protein analogous to peritrophins 3-A1 [Nesidiocoris tenuis]
MLFLLIRVLQATIVLGCGVLSFDDQGELQLCTPGSENVIPHPEFCDKYVHCDGGKTSIHECEDGLAYDPPLKTCRPLHTVDCSSRPHLQPPKGNEDCPRRYGVFPDPKGCGRFFKCVNGTAVPDKCSPGLMFDPVNIGCRDSSKEEAEQCQQIALLGCNFAPDLKENLDSCTWFRCPVDDPYPWGEHSRHPYPGNCRFYILCIRGGSVKIQGCPEGSAYSAATSTCVPEQELPNCKVPKNLAPYISEILR